MVLGAVVLLASLAWVPSAPSSISRDGASEVSDAAGIGSQRE